MNSSELASITETLLFIVGEPLEAEDIKKVTGAGNAILSLCRHWLLR